jgi:branched-subunit amino acid aminotransferase/4-amino-4-deoxychorismate lyase
MTQTFPPRLEVDGRPAGLEQVWALDLSPRGHFTAMQVRGGGTLGLDFHLARLDAATRELFGTGLDGDLVRGYLRHALDGTADATVRANVYLPDGASAPSVMVSVRPPAAAPGRPQRLQSVPYQRPLAHVKHSTGFGQNYYGGLTSANGFDEALFAGPDGAISEGSITNIAFLDGDAIVWPSAPALLGVMMQVLQRELTAAGVPWRHAPVHLASLPGFGGALVTNSHGMAPVASIDDLVFPGFAGGSGGWPPGSAQPDGGLYATAAKLLAAAPYDTI